jgi:hypothetical protein
MAGVGKSKAAEAAGDFHINNGVHVHRNEDGGVTLYREVPGRELEVLVRMEAGVWCSAVLSVSAFGDRPGDWGAIMAHHQGRKDMLAGQRGGY